MNIFEGRTFVTRKAVARRQCIRRIKEIQENEGTQEKQNQNVISARNQATLKRTATDTKSGKENRIIRKRVIRQQST